MWLVAELCGVGKVADLQNALQQERKNWTQVTNQLVAELGSKRARLAGLKERASRLTEQDSSVDALTTMWSQWWNLFGQIVPLTESVPELGATASDAALDRAVRALDAAKREAARRRDDLTDTLEVLETVRSGKPQRNLDSLNTALVAAEAAETQRRDHLAKAEAANLVVQQELRTASTKERERRALAELALRHLGDKCPVCDQAIDQDTTRVHLRELMTSPFRHSAISPW